MKTCVECLESKSIYEFGSSQRRTGARSNRCASCRSSQPRHATRQEWMKSYRRRYLLRKYGLTENDYDQLARIQDHKCLLCMNPETMINPKSGEIAPLAVDHDHQSNQVRGLLCSRCNRMLGLVNDDTDLLLRMINYLRLRPACYDAVVEVPIGFLIAAELTS